MTHDSTKGYLNTVPVELAIHLQLESPPLPRNCRVLIIDVPVESLFKKSVCAIMPSPCGTTCALPTTIIITTMTISESLGRAWLVEKYVLNANQSPNALAKGDLFCLNLNTKDTKITKVGHMPQRKGFLRILFVYPRRPAWQYEFGGASCTKHIPVGNCEPATPPKK